MEAGALDVIGAAFRNFEGSQVVWLGRDAGRGGTELLGGEGEDALCPREVVIVEVEVRSCHVAAAFVLWLGIDTCCGPFADWCQAGHGVQGQWWANGGRMDRQKGLGDEEWHSDTIRTSAGPSTHPTRQPVSENSLLALPTHSVRSRMPGRSAMRACVAPPHVVFSYTSSAST